MKKISIITLNGYFNYGNRLQNYALQKVLENNGFEVETLVIERNNKKRGRSYYFLRKVYRKLRPLFVNHQQKVHLRRENEFMRFTKKFINETNNIIQTTEDLSYLNEKYDQFVIGSDQVWNPTMNNRSSVFFGNFAQKEKVISYAASFGLSELPEEDINNYTEWLLNISRISVREIEGAQIVKDLTGRHAEVLVDPTMLLSKEEWLELAKKAENRDNSPYILTYFLGGPSEENRIKIDKIAKENGMKVINMGDIKEEITYETGPSEFLDYINNASAFFTDSFHGVVFSIIFKTPFIIFERLSTGSSMYSRIETILENFNMKDREADGFHGDIFSMDFSNSEEVLLEEQQKSSSYLKNALKIEE